MKTSHTDLLNHIRGIQQTDPGLLPCPRCGGTMRHILEENKLSRHAQVYICNDCGTDEAMRDFAHSPIPMDAWNFLSNSPSPCHAVTFTPNSINAIDFEVAYNIIRCSFECWFDLEDKLGEFLLPDEWINLYAFYEPERKVLSMAYTVNSDDCCEGKMYIPSEADIKVILEVMERDCRKEFGCNLSDLVNISNK